MMIPLNLPPAPLKIEREGARLRVFDSMRGRFVTLTPEEWVRQHFVHFLVNVARYPAALIGNEVSLELNSTRRRADTVVYSRDGRPWMIVEYKAPSIPLTAEVFDQVLRYNLVFRAPFLTLSNGLTTITCAIDAATGTHRFLRELPPFPTQ